LEQKYIPHLEHKHGKWMPTSTFDRLVPLILQ
jgi:hypothetical protein